MLCEDPLRASREPIIATAFQPVACLIHRLRKKPLTLSASNTYTNETTALLYNLTAKAWSFSVFLPRP